MGFQIVKERVRKLFTNLVFVPIETKEQRDTNYGLPGTDIRRVKFPKGEQRFELVTQRRGKVSQIVKRHGADLGFNFPFFDRNAELPIGYIWNGRYVNGAYGQMKEWYEIGFKDGSATIGKFTTEQRESYDFSVQGKIIVENGKYVGQSDGQACQRTFGWLDAKGDFYMAFADGRTRSDKGLTVEEMGLYALKHGAAWALEGDGGGSTILADQSGGLNQKLNTGENERAVHHAVLVFQENRYKDEQLITFGDLKKLGLVKG